MCCVQHVCTHRIIDEETEDAPGWSPGGERGSHSASTLRGPGALVMFWTQAQLLRGGLLSRVLVSFWQVGAPGAGRLGGLLRQGLRLVSRVVPSCPARLSRVCAASSWPLL